MNDILHKMEKTLAQIEQLKEKDLCEMLSNLLGDNINFSLMQRSHIATMVNSKLSGAAQGDSACSDMAGNADNINGVGGEQSLNDVWQVTKEGVSQLPRLQAPMTRGNDSSEDTLVDPDSRTILSRYEDHTTAPRDTLRSLQIVNHAKMTVHYHFHDHQHLAESEAVAKDVDQQGPSDQMDNLSTLRATSPEELEPGEVPLYMPLQAISSKNRRTSAADEEASTKSAKRSISETVPSNTQVYLPPAKRVKDRDPSLSIPAAPLNVNSLHALFGKPQGQAVVTGLAQMPATQPKPAPSSQTHGLKCRHCKKWFTVKDNHSSACGVHKGRKRDYKGGVVDRKTGKIIFKAWDCCLMAMDVPGCCGKPHKAV